jgi:glucose-1-phosphate cytidylyltransferase
MKVVILAGGYGTRFGKVTDFLPKPMIPIGPYPILWHIMRIYGHYGFDDFVICLGYKAELLKDFFLNYESWTNDFTVDLRRLPNPSRTVHRRKTNSFYPRVTLAYTGQDTMTGGRLKRIADFLDGDDFMLTYGDGVANINLKDLLAFHRAHGKIATLSAVFPPPKFGDLKLDGDAVTTFAEKQAGYGSHINGGFYVFKRKFLDYLSNDTSCVMEKQPMEALASEDQLMAYRHDGFWQCMDTTRDLELLQKLWSTRSAPWKIWADDYED